MSNKTQNRVTNTILTLSVVTALVGGVSAGVLAGSRIAASLPPLPSPLADSNLLAITGGIAVGLIAMVIIGAIGILTAGFTEDQLSQHRRRRIEKTSGQDQDAYKGT